MPKSTKDTGGCQVFVMHMAAPHLDQHYTAFGTVVGSGLRFKALGSRELKGVPGSWRVYAVA